MWRRETADSAASLRVQVAKKAETATVLMARGVAARSKRARPWYQVSPRGEQKWKSLHSFFLCTLTYD